MAITVFVKVAVMLKNNFLGGVCKEDINSSYIR